MTSLINAASHYHGVVLRRGAPQRLTDFMEQFQVGIVRSIASAAGCEFLSSSIDDGIDCSIKRRFQGKLDSEIEVQLKAVSNAGRWDSNGTKISAKLSKSRYDTARITPSDDLIMRRIIVIMDMPPVVDDWLTCEHNSFQISHACYWLSLEGYPAVRSTQQNVAVSAPVEQVFDDAALCAIMEKINKRLPL